MEYIDDKKFIDVCLPKIIVIDEFFDKAIAKIKRCSFFASHGRIRFQIPHLAAE